MEHNQASCRGITNRKEENTVFRGKHTTSTILLNAHHSEDIPRTAVIIQDSDGRIKELARGDISSNSKIFGNPSALEYLDLNDIHPASWFSVSWYPIYRIPDGNFRAAFLTYHSLGNLIHRNDASNPNSALHIVCPAVGLQSYNSQGECWFRANEYKFKGGREKSLSSNSSKILEDRLRTLEQTASVMARASVYKGALKSVNKQPDYEFFLSRSRRW